LFVKFLYCVDNEYFNNPEISCPYCWYTTHCAFAPSCFILF